MPHFGHVVMIDQDMFRLSIILSTCEMVSVLAGLHQAHAQGNQNAFDVLDWHAPKYLQRFVVAFNIADLARMACH